MVDMAEDNDDANIDANVVKDDDNDDKTLTIVLSDLQEHVLVTTANGIVMTSTLQPLKMNMFHVRRWMLLMTMIAKIDEAVTQLNRKT